MHPVLVSATADLPLILTPRAIDALRPYLLTNVGERLRDLALQFIHGHVEPLFAPSHDDFDASLLRAVPRAGRPRTELVMTLLEAMDPTRGAEAMREAFDTAQTALKREGWRLGEGLDALMIAVEELRELVRHPDPPPETPPPPSAREALESLFVRGVELDLCLLGPLAYLEGDLPGADASRLRRACELAAVNAAVASSRMLALSGAELTPAERSTLLHDLAGSWPDSDEAERALQGTYEDRTRDR